MLVATKYACLQIYRWRFLNEWEAFKFFISRSNVHRHIHSFPTRRSSDLDDAAQYRFGSELYRAGPRFASRRDRKSTRLNSSHLGISYAVFCLKKKKKTKYKQRKNKKKQRIKTSSKFSNKIHKSNKIRKST